MSFDLKKIYGVPLYRNSVLIILNTGLGAFFGLLFWIVGARVMPPEEVGIISAIISATMFIMSLSRLGIDAGIVRFLPKSTDKNSLYNIASIIPLTVSLVLTSIFLLGLNFFSPSLIMLRDSQYLMVFVAYVMISTVSYMQNTTLLALRRADLYLIQNLIASIRVPLLFFAYALFPETIGVLLILDIAYMASLIFGRLMLSKFGLRFSTGIDWSQFKPILKFSLGNYSANIFAIAPISIIPIMIINVVGPASNAFFFVAYSTASLMTMIPSAICASLFVEGSHDMPLRDTAIKSIKLITLLMVPAFLILFLFGDKILLLFSTEYSVQSFEILQMLCVSGIFSALTLFYISIKKIQKDMRLVNIINSTISVLIIVLGYVFLTTYGLVGIGYAWLLVNVIISILILMLIITKEKWISFSNITKIIQ